MERLSRYRHEDGAGDVPLATPLHHWATLTLAYARAIRAVESLRCRCLPTARAA